MFSSEDEHRHVRSSDDEPLIPSSRVDPHESLTQPPKWVVANVGGRTFDPQHL